MDGRSAALAPEHRFGVGRASPHPVEPKAAKELGMFLSSTYLSRIHILQPYALRPHSSLCLRGSMTDSVAPRPP